MPARPPHVADAPFRGISLTRKLILLLVVVIGAGALLIGLQLGGRLSASDLLLEIGYVTIGTVAVTLLYDQLLREPHEAELMETVQRSLIANAREYGLQNIEQMTPELLLKILRRLERGDELLWLDTYCYDLNESLVRDALRRAVAGGAKIRMLMIHPDAITADLRAQELEHPRLHGVTVFSDQVSRITAIVETLQDDLESQLGTEVDVRRKLFQVRAYRGLPCAPLMLRLHQGQLLEGWTSYYLTVPTYKSAYLYWSQASRAPGKLSQGRGLGLQEFCAYFETKWTDVGAGHELVASYRALDRWDNSRIERALREAPAGSRVRILETWVPELDDLLDPLINKDKAFQIQVLLMDPGAAGGCSSLLSARMKYRRDFSLQVAKNDILKTVAGLQRAADAVDSDPSVTLETKFYDFLPFGPLYDIAGRMFAGIYPAHVRSEAGPMLVVDRRDGAARGNEVWAVLDMHFQTAWQGARNVRYDQASDDVIFV